MPQFEHSIAALTNASSGAVNTSKKYYFQTIGGVIFPVEEQNEIISVPGKNGHGTRYLGKQAPDSTLTTLEFCETMAEATVRLAAYKALIEKSNAPLGVHIIQSGLSYYPADVRSVNFASPPRLAASVCGAIIANPNVVCECTWVIRMRNV